MAEDIKKGGAYPGKGAEHFLNLPGKASKRFSLVTSNKSTEMFLNDSAV